MVGLMRLNVLIDEVLRAMAESAAKRGGPVPAVTPAELAAQVRTVLAAAGGALPDSGTGPLEAVSAITSLLVYGAADPADPACAAHLHCPPLPEAVAADLAVSALNPSLDSWDQAPAAVTLERELVTALAGLAGFDPGRASGTVTTGGSESNLMGLMLARDHAPRGHRRVFCSQGAHFSIRRAAALLGLDGVEPIATDSEHRMDPARLAAALADCERAGDVPVAVVATAGTTDTGAVDPLAEIADVASAHGVRLHVDAAHGGGALLSDRLAPLLRGIERADSVAIDLHKFGWVPAAAGVFLVRDAEAMAALETRAAYLNPADDVAEGYDGLLGQSLRTTRRADCAKILVVLRSLGRRGLGELVDRCHDLALRAADLIVADPELELVAPPMLSTVVFRYRDSDEVNAALRRRLLRQGRAVVGRTELDGRVCLKLTMLNPETDVASLLSAVVMAGREESR